MKTVLLPPLQRHHTTQKIQDRGDRSVPPGFFCNQKCLILCRCFLIIHQEVCDIFHFKLNLISLQELCTDGYPKDSFSSQIATSSRHQNTPSKWERRGSATRGTKHWTATKRETKSYHNSCGHSLACLSKPKYLEGEEGVFLPLVKQEQS